MTPEKIILTPEEIQMFTQWVIENIDGSIIPNDEGNEGSFLFNLIHAIRGDNEKYEYFADQDNEIESWDDHRKKHGLI